MLSDKVLKEYNHSLEIQENLVKKAKQRRNFVKNYLPQVIPSNIDVLVRKYRGQYFSSGMFNDLYIIIPWIPELCDEIALSLEVFGWYKYHEYTKTDSTEKPEMYILYKHEWFPDFCIKLNMESCRELSCKLIQVGVKEVPIWQVKCE